RISLEIGQRVDVLTQINHSFLRILKASLTMLSAFGHASMISRLENKGELPLCACDMMRCMRSTLRLIARAAFIIPIMAAVAPPEVIINGRRTVVVESPAAT